MKTNRIRLPALLALLAVCNCGAQNYSIDWYKIAGGGGTSSNGQYSVSGTIGQHDATTQTLSGGNFSLTGGFWSLLSVVPTAGAPKLTNIRSGNSVKVSWLYPSTGWTLQQNANLTAAAWSASGGVSNDGTNNFITITPPAGNLFFRLRQ